MGTSDGTVVGATKVLDNGPDVDRYNIVFLAEGYQDAEQPDFNDAVGDFIADMQAEPWFSSLLPAINVHRINVESTDSGADDPTDCGGTGADVDTYFDASFCNSDIRRLLTVDTSLAEDVLDDEVPEWDVAVALVNSTVYGGAGGGIATTAVNGNWTQVVLHELGHSAFGLADEYDYWAGCSTDTDRDIAPAGEPTAPNVTTATTIAGLKWAHLVGSLTPVPTMENPDCTQCDRRANVLADQYEVGLFEGAQYYHCGRYRPVYSCKMRDLGSFFCRVCVEAIHDTIRPFFGTIPALAVDLLSLDFGSVGAGATRTLRVEISNVGTPDVTGIAVATDNPRYTAALAGGTTLAAGASEFIDVTLGPFFATGSQTGTLTITSSAATLTVALDGTICTAAPSGQVVTGDGSRHLDFGDVALGLTMYRELRIRNVVTACSGTLSVTLSNLAAPYGYAPGTSLTFTLPAPGAAEPHTEQILYVAFTAPTSGDLSPTDTITISSPDDPVLDGTAVTLAGTSVPPPQVDSVLVIDRSGSMSDPTGVPGSDKTDLAIEAANLYVSLLKDSDQIGVVRYNNVSRDPQDILLDMVLAGDAVTGAGRASARGVLTRGNLNPSGATSIGAGIIRGSDVLEGGSADSRALVVLTDGRQNILPDIPDAQADVATKVPAQQVFAAGLGLNQLEDTLNQIASVTNGTAHITGNLVAQREFLLQKLYVQILSDVADEAFITDPVMVLDPQASHATDVWIGDVDIAADFIVAYRQSNVHPKYMQVWLEAPDGTVISPADASAMPNVDFHSFPGHMYFRCLFPTFPDRPAAHRGRWRVWVANKNVEEWHGRIPLRYAVMAKARSDLLLRGRILQQEHGPGSPMEIQLEPMVYGTPIEVDGLPVARVERPDGIVRMVELEPNAYGQYAATFADTALPGPYQVTSQVDVTTPRGDRVTRYRQMTGIIFYPGREPQRPARDTDNTDGKDVACEEAKRALDYLARFVEECCEKAEDDRNVGVAKWLADLGVRIDPHLAVRRLDD